MKELDKLKEKLARYDALLDEIKKDEQALKAELAQALEQVDESLEDSLPSTVLGLADDDQQVLDLLGINEYDAKRDEYKVLSLYIRAKKFDKAWVPVAHVEKIVHSSARTTTVTVNESSDGYRPGGTFEKKISSSEEKKRVWQMLSYRERIFELARALGKKIDDARAELMPVAEAKKEALMDKYNKALSKLYEVKERVSDERYPVYLKVSELEKKARALKEMEEWERVTRMGWEDSPYG
jgi:hypothetical protein